ncbi:hypothetical protein F7725_012277, partial [Dissostichus mawsoni]
MTNEDRQFYICNCFTTDNIFLEEYKLHVRFVSEQQFRRDYGVIVDFCRVSAVRGGALGDLLQEEAAARVYRFPVFERSFCEQLVEELEHFEQSSAPKGRPNTMNHYGRYLQPLTSLLYPDCGGGSLDSHKAFVVKYDMDEDRDLSYHYDNAEVTLNVSLGKDFTEGNLYFGDMRQVPLSEMQCWEVEHRVSEGLLHRGQQMHGALPISSGQRWNLIVWIRASQERNKLCPMCNRRPELVEGGGFADGFTKPCIAPLNAA